MHQASHRRLPISPEWIPLELAIEHAPFWRFVFLSMLLHTLAILMFGAPSGGSREGRAMWGTLQAVLAPLPASPAPRAAPLEAPKPAAPTVSPAPDAAETPFTFPPLLDRLPAPDIKLEALPALRVPPPTEVQAPPAAPIPAPLLQPLPSVPESAALPSFERVPEIRAPAEAPPIPAPLLQPLPQVQERAALPPLERAVLPPIEPAPAVPAAQPAPAAPETRRPPVPETTRPAVPDAPSGPTLRDPMERAPPSPESPFRRRDEPAGTLDPTRPALDPDALRKRAGELAREGTGQRALLPFPMPPIAPPKSKLETAIENARKPDCRDAYKALGLAAVVPLIANEFGEGSCRW